MKQIRMRAALCVALALILTACGSSRRGAEHSDVRPRDVANICAIYRDNPHWAQAAAEAEARWGAPQEIKMAIIWRESTFRGDARPPYRRVMGMPTGQRLSSAYGFAQAIDGTWDWYVRETGSRADRDVFVDSVDFVGWYMAKTRDMTGVPTWDAFNQYLAYHEGQRGYQRGTWRAKPEVQRAAAQVAAQAERYRAQRRYCAAGGNV